MLEFLNGTDIYDGEYEGATITGFNSDTKKFIIKYDDGETKEINILDNSHTIWNIDYFDKWQEKLFNKLVLDGRAIVQVLSTESGDSYFFTIYRHKTLIAHSKDMIITNYIIEFCNEIKGDILSRQHKKHEALFNELADFKNWIEDQIEKVGEFNNSEHWSTFDSIVFSDAFLTMEEVNLLGAMFNEKWFPETK